MGSEPFYKHPYFVLPAIIIITGLIAYGIAKYLPEYFKDITPKDIKDLSPLDTSIDLINFE
jgi:hypothetical protein